MADERALSETLQRWRAQPFAWGVDDCQMSVADYWRLVTGDDPAAAWRGSYDDEAGAQAVMDAIGGGLALMCAGLGSVRARPVAEPLRGDLVCAAIGTEQIPGLCLGQRVAFRRPGRGVVEAPLLRLDILGVWRPA